MTQWGQWGGDSKGQRLYQASVKQRLTRFIKSAHGVPEAMKVTNQMARLAMAGQVPQPARIYHSHLAQVTVA